MPCQTNWRSPRPVHICIPEISSQRRPACATLSEATSLQHRQGGSLTSSRLCQSSCCYVIHNAVIHYGGGKSARTCTSRFLAGTVYSPFYEHQTYSRPMGHGLGLHNG